MSEERRASERRAEDRLPTPNCWDAALVMGVLYTVIFAGVLGMLFLTDIPAENQKTMDILAGAMAMIQGTVVQYFFGSSKNAENSQRMIAVSKEKTDDVLRTAVTSAVAAPQPQEPPK